MLVEGLNRRYGPAESDKRDASRSFVTSVRLVLPAPWWLAVFHETQVREDAYPFGARQYSSHAKRLVPARVLIRRMYVSP